MLISLLMVVFAGIIAAFSTSYWMFLFFRFIVSIGVSGSIQNCFVLSKKNYKHKVELLRWMMQLLLCSCVNCSRLFIPFPVFYCSAVTEHADKGYRAMLGIIEQVPFAIGYMMLPGLAYFLRDWNTLQLSFGVISTGLVVYYWYSNNEHVLLHCC